MGNHLSLEMCHINSQWRLCDGACTGWSAAFVENLLGGICCIGVRRKKVARKGKAGREAEKARGGGYLRRCLHCFAVGATDVNSR
jgi:hypothetical protein